MENLKEKIDLECEAKMEGVAQALDWDSDETVIEGSVTESDPEDEELPWRRLLFNQDISSKSVFSLHSGINGMFQGMLSPEIKLGLKLKNDLQEQMHKNKTMPILSADIELQQHQDETTINQGLLQTKEKFPVSSLLFSQSGLSLHSQNIEGSEAENTEILLHPEKELDTPEISLFSSTAVTDSDTAVVKEKSLIETEKILSVPNTSEPEQEVTLNMTSKECMDEDSSVETFVSALEKVLTSENINEERLLETMKDFDFGELMSPLSVSPSSISAPTNALSACCRDLVENTKDDSLPAELLAAINTLSEAKVGASCHRKEQGGKNECFEVEADLSQMDEDCTQVTEGNFDSLCSSFEQSSNLARLQDNILSVEKTVKNPNPFGLQTLAHSTITSYEPLNNMGNSNPVENVSKQEIPCVLRRSSRLEKLRVSRKAKHGDTMCKSPEKILPKILSSVQINKTSSTENFRVKHPALWVDSKEMNKHSSRVKSEHIRKNEQIEMKTEKIKTNKRSFASINRRNIFGENLVYKAALDNDVDLIRHYIKNGGNVNQPCYAGWTALHEASVGGFYQIASELLKGGADVNTKGMYQITPLHDAVINGHYKVAELLLLNGADPLFSSDNGKCPLDEAKDSQMKLLLEKYVSNHNKCLKSVQSNGTYQVGVQDAHQHKKLKFSSTCCESVSNENSNQYKPENEEVNKERNEGLLISNEDIYEHCENNPSTTKFGRSKPKQSSATQIYSRELRKPNHHNVKGTSSNVSKSKRRDLQHKTQADNGDYSSRQAIAVTSSRRISKLVSHQQHVPQTFNDFPQDSCEFSSSTLSSLKSGLVNNIGAFSSSKEIHTHNLDLSSSQEMKVLEVESIDQREAVSRLPSPKEIRLPFVTTDQQLHTHQEQHNSPYKSQENGNSVKKNDSFNKWENSFLAFIRAHFDSDDSDSSTSEKTAASKKEACKKHHNYKENTINSEEMDSQQLLPFDDHFSQENELKAGSLTTQSQQEAVNFCDSDDTIISEQYVPNYEQHISFDHSYCNPEQISLASTIMPSTLKVSNLTSHVEPLKKPQDASSREPTPSMSQADIHNVENMNVEEEQGTEPNLSNQMDTYNAVKVCMEEKQGTKRNCNNKEQNTSSSNSFFPTVVDSEEMGTTEVEKNRQDFPEKKPMNNTGFHFTDNMNKELTNTPQLNKKEKEISHKSDDELTDSINRDESLVKTYEAEKEKMYSEIHRPLNTPPNKRGQNFRKRKNFLKSNCIQEIKTARINRRYVKGKSQLHLAARRGNLSHVKALIESGLDVNLKDNEGWTPLHEASNKGYTDIVTELLKAGANVNCENVNGILPLHDAVAGNHLKAAEILLQHGADPNKRDQKKKTAFDEADSEKLKELLKSYDAIGTNDRSDSSAMVTVKFPAGPLKRCRQYICDNDKTFEPHSSSHQAKRRESLPMHQTISDILQDIEEKQENLLEFEIRSPDDAEQYIEKMLEIKEVMDNILAKQKAERDELAKKYRVSIESFKHGVLREQLANLATRQKSLLLAAKRQKKIRQRIQNYENLTSFSLRKLSSISDISGEKNNKELTSLENSVCLQSDSLSPVNLDCGSMQETWNDGQNANICLNPKAGREEEFSGNEMNSKEIFNNCTLDDLSKLRHLDGTDKIELPSQAVAFTVQVEYPQKENDLTEATAKDQGLYIPAIKYGTVNVSEYTNVLSQNDVCPSAVDSGFDISHFDPERRYRKTAPQELLGGVSESLTQQRIAALGTDAVNQIKPHLKKPSSGGPHTNNTQISPASGSGNQHPIKKPLNHTPKKRNIQIKDLLLLGRINPGNNVLEFKTQETVHKASILLNGKLKVENGQIYQSPVTWLKDLLGDVCYVTWNYAWSKISYLGKELLKYVSEEVPLPSEPNVVLQQPCLSGTSRESVQNIPHYLQIKEILSISDQEFLPCHVMAQHWKFYVECEELTF
ncbi:ankyrin repeat domain-containing protein 31 [Thomomys bottae]